MQSANIPALVEREYHHFCALKYAICDGSDTARIQTCFQLLQDDLKHISRAHKEQLGRCFELMPRELKTAQFCDFVHYYLVFQGQCFISRGHTGMGVGRQFADRPCYDETQSLEELYNTASIHPVMEELELVVISSFRNEAKLPIDPRLLPFVLPTHVPLLDQYSFPDVHDDEIRRVFEESEFCTRSQAINGFSFTFNSNIEQCSDQWIEERCTHNTRFLFLTFTIEDLDATAMRAILRKCVCIARPRFLTISFTGQNGYDRTVPRSFSIVRVLLDLLLLITNWPCDAHICVESSIDSDSKWLVALININPVYLLRVSLYHCGGRGGISYSQVYRVPFESCVAPVKLCSDFLKREVRAHALRLHVAAKFFPFGQNPYGGEMHSVAQCFRACSYYNRHFPEMCAYLGGEFPPRPADLKD